MTSVRWGQPVAVLVENSPSTSSEGEAGDQPASAGFGLNEAVEGVGNAFTQPLWTRVTMGQAHRARAAVSDPAGPA